MCKCRCFDWQSSGAASADISSMGKTLPHTCKLRVLDAARHPTRFPKQDELVSRVLGSGLDGELRQNPYLTCVSYSSDNQGTRDRHRSWMISRHLFPGLLASYPAYLGLITKLRLQNISKWRLKGSEGTPIFCPI